MLEFEKKRKGRLSASDVEQIRRHFQSLIEAPPQQRISKKIFREQVKRDELAVLKEKYSEATLLSKVHTERKRICQRKISLFSNFLQMLSFYSRFNDKKSI